MDKNSQVLSMLANQHRDFVDYSQEYMIDTALDDKEIQELVNTTLSVLSENPRYSKQIDFLQTIETKSVGIDVAVLVAVTFLLRTHVKVLRDKAGKWSLLIEHKPDDSKVLDKLLSRLNVLINDS